MNYQDLIKKVAEFHNTTPEDVDREIQAALLQSGYECSPETAIALMSAKVKKTINSN